MASNIQTLRLRRPEQKKPQSAPARHTGILQDQLRRAQKRPWNPSFSLAVRILLIMRVASAMYSNIQDCDEVFNFWEPLHYVDRGYAFQTWETSPVYAIRSYAYVLLHLLPAKLPYLIFGRGKRPSFFAVRIFLAVISALCEAKLFRVVVEKINERVGRYLFFMLLSSVGMWNAAPAFLPSSFAMYACTLAFAYSLEPSTSANTRRTLLTTLSFATGAIVGWPFALAIAIPFVIEELFVLSGDRVEKDKRLAWMISRWLRLFTAGMTAALIFVPVIAIDSVAYGRWTVVPWNIIKYNVFGGADRGPELYGTAPWHFYLLNLTLNFNLLVPLALAALPALGVTFLVDKKRLGLAPLGKDQSSPFALLGLRLLPFYVWMGILTAQPHKEERFMFPAYPMLCFNAAVALYLMRGWLEVAYVSVTKSPYRASRSSIFRSFTYTTVLVSCLLSVSRIFALFHYYHAPLGLALVFEAEEIPHLLNITGLLPPPPPDVKPEDLPPIDIKPISEFGLRVCYGKEWYRFPGHYLVPDGVRVDWVKSEFDGLLPGHFTEVHNMSHADQWWGRPGTRAVPQYLNDLNREEPSHYVSVDSCDYLVDIDFPLHPSSSSYEPRYAADTATWHRVACLPFLDARHSAPLTRALWAPGEAWRAGNEFGDYCLLRNRRLVEKKVREAKGRATLAI